MFNRIKFAAFAAAALIASVQADIWDFKDNDGDEFDAIELVYEYQNLKPGPCPMRGQNKQ